MNLKLIASIVTLASAFVFTATSYGQAAPACQTGKLLDVREDTEHLPAVQFGRVHRNGNKDWTTVELPSTRKQTTTRSRLRWTVSSTLRVPAEISGATIPRR